MSEDAIKKRVARAKQKAIVHYRRVKYGIIKSDNETFCFIATRRREARFVRVVVDRITDADLRLVRSVELPSECAREIYCQREDEFEIREIEA